MKDDSQGNVTKLLLKWRSGDEDAFNVLMPLVYEELRRIAQRKSRQYGLGNIQQPTSIVHEAYIRLIDCNEVDWRNRAHFFAVASISIRRILIEDFRKRTADKRGGGVAFVSLSDAEASSEPNAIDFLALNEAIDKLEKLDEQQARIVELRFFGGLNNDEVAEVLEISRATVEREWRDAKAWLHMQLSS